MWDSGDQVSREEEGRDNRVAGKMGLLLKVNSSFSFFCIAPLLSSPLSSFLMLNRIFFILLYKLHLNGCFFAWWVNVHKLIIMKA